MAFHTHSSMPLPLLVCAVCRAGFGGDSCEPCSVGTWSGQGTAVFPRPDCIECAPGRTTPGAGSTIAGNCSGVLTCRGGLSHQLNCSWTCLSTVCCCKCMLDTHAGPHLLCFAKQCVCTHPNPLPQCACLALAGPPAVSALWARGARGYLLGPTAPCAALARQLPPLAARRLTAALVSAGRYIVASGFSLPNRTGQRAVVP